MLLSGLFFFRTFTPVFFWSKGKIEELSYFKMKSKLHIQLYTLPSTPFFGYSKYSFRFGKRNSQPSGLRSGWVSKFRVLNKRMNFFWDPVFHCFIIWFPIGIFLSVFFLRPKKRFFDSNHFSELQVVCGEQEKFQEDFILKSCFFYRFTTLQVHIVRKYKLVIISRKYWAILFKRRR